MKKVAAAIIEHPEAGFLLEKRDDSAPMQPHTWVALGGHIEGEEMFLTALLRELMEELSFNSKDIVSCKLLELNAWPTYPQQAIFHIITHKDPTLFVHNEGYEVNWVAKENVFDYKLGFNFQKIFHRFFSS